MKVKFSQLQTGYIATPEPVQQLKFAFKVLRIVTCSVRGARCQTQSREAAGSSEAASRLLPFHPSSIVATYLSAPAAVRI